ncbi:hypothetical protein [Burkholderia sp. Ac-20353]|uniref:hypothetical protein n=1 Tax=Burkholderia sp. Ac-20353 TaxID=2703894 RepID=UPI00197BFDAF|nr:hypothetical protein [Burkholderia sp. Ac-20353]MBN3788152.1 hypothetical protein [Burkholderia sp. Ac-20353]
MLPNLVRFSLSMISKANPMTGENDRNERGVRGPARLVVEIYDRETESIVQTHSFDVRDISDLCRILRIDSFEPWECYELDERDIELLSEAYDIRMDRDGLAKLRLTEEHDEHPYLLHTNRELLLMLEGRKPFSAFVDEDGSSGKPSRRFPEAKFDAFVAAGRFVKHEYFEPSGIEVERQIRRVLYAAPGEAWRINAYLLLLETSKCCGWSEGFERLEGSLLGYSSEENDMHVLLQQKYRGSIG